MEIAKIQVTGVTAVPVACEPIPRGIIGAQVRFEYADPLWDGLTKTVVFKGASVADTLNAGELVTIPAEVAARAGHTLYVGVYGVDAENNIAIPTLWADLGRIQGATETSGEEAAEPQLPVWAQLDARVAKLEEEPAGSVDAEEVQQILEEYLEENPPVGIPGEKGATGPQGESGKDGVSVTHSWDGTVLSVTSASGTSSADLKGEKGEAGTAGKDAKIVAQDTAPEDTSVLWVDTTDESGTEQAFANPLYGKTIVFHGDSICAGSGDTLGGYGKIIADRNGMSYQNIAVGGATITAEMYSQTSGNAYHWISRTIGNMDETADYAIVEGGLNDAWHASPMGAISDGFDSTLDDTTYYGAFESMLKQLILRFPGKKIGYIAVHKRAPDFDSRSTGDYYTAAVECCRKWGIPVCDLNTSVPPLGHMDFFIPTYTLDGSHPTVEGYSKYYCDKIEAWLKTL